MPSSRISEAQLTTANTNLDGTGTTVDLITGVAGDTEIRQIQIKAVTATNSGMIRLFIKKSAGPTRLYREVPVSAVTPSGSVSSWESAVVIAGVRLSLGDKLIGSTQNSETFNVIIFATDLA